MPPLAPRTYSCAALEDDAIEVVFSPHDDGKMNIIGSSWNPALIISKVEGNLKPSDSSWDSTTERMFEIFEDEVEDDDLSRSGAFLSYYCMTRRLCVLAISSFLLAVIAFVGVGLLVEKAQQSNAEQPSNLLQGNDQLSTLLPSTSPSHGPSHNPPPSPLQLSASISPPSPAPLPAFTSSPSPAPTHTPVKPSKITVGVYYYPWHHDDFHFDTGYLRDQLDPPQRPFLGEYNDQDASVIAQHLAWSRQANVQLWVTSWWGPDRREDTATLKILQHRDIGQNKIALFYESTGRILKKEGATTTNIVPDIGYMCENYFGDDHYFKIDGRPVLFIYVTRKLYRLNLLKQVVDLMRFTAAGYGFDPYIIGDQVFADAPFADEGTYPPFDYLDGVTGYDSYGTIMGDKADDEFYAGNLNSFEQRSHDWKRLARLQSCTFIPCVTPGYNDRGVRQHADHGPLSRRLRQTAEPGSLFRALLEQARYFVDESTSNLLLVNSFNEWHEDTQIEPTVVSASTTLPLNLTQGVEYEGYGELYLNILREMTEDSEE
jgi:glycoprotein endo-alpha-1,2-mannosidase